jgi:hypothetical protein
MTGWQMVPVEPTEAMTDAAEALSDHWTTWADAWRAMLAAAPPAPSAVPVAWVKENELAELLACNHRRLWADSPRIWAPYDVSSPSADMKLVALYRDLPPDHAAVMRQALEALEKARDTTYSDTLYPQCEVAIDALNKALGEKR